MKRCGGDKWRKPRTESKKWLQKRVTSFSDMDKQHQSQSSLFSLHGKFITNAIISRGDVVVMWGSYSLKPLGVPTLHDSRSRLRLFTGVVPRPWGPYHLLSIVTSVPRIFGMTTNPWTPLPCGGRDGIDRPKYPGRVPRSSTLTSFFYSE